MPVLDFWLEFASTYSYLAAMRVDGVARKAGVEVNWRPFLLGAIFKKQGWETSPFNIFEDKGRHMWRDLERQTEAQGLAFRRPDPFPQPSLLPARLALTASIAPVKPSFCRAVFAMEFGEGRPIGEAETMSDILRLLDVDPDQALREAQSEGVKQKLREQTDEAQRRSVFGAPTFLTQDGELFWGNDRLESAVAWAARQGSN
ncbi:MAG: 2-hydroxychromene-2-carboxylate isomerase [Parvibaculaceae bacterium]